MVLMKLVNLRFLLGVTLVWLYLFIGLFPAQASAQATYRPTYTLQQNEHIKLTGGFLTSGNNPVFYNGRFGGTINDTNRAYINEGEQAIYFLYQSSSTLYVTHYDYIFNSNTNPRDETGPCWPALKLNGVTATVAGVSKASDKETAGCTKSAQDLANMSPGIFDSIDFTEQAKAAQQDAEVAPLVKLACGKLAPPAGLGGYAAEVMQKEYDECKKVVVAAYDSCYVSPSSVGSSVVAEAMNKPESRGKCFMEKMSSSKYSGYTLPQVVTAITEGQAASTAIANNTSEQIGCASKGGTWRPGADPNTGTCEFANTAGDAPTSLCGFDGDSMEWVICPVTTALQSFSRSLASNIEGLMFFPTQDVFGKTGTGGATDNLHTAWASFRNIAIAIIVIAGLTMVISQALGFEILDAYTIRKLLPRLGVALVGIALSWNLMQFFIEFTNDLGSWTHDLLVGPFANMPVAKIDTSNQAYNWATVLGLIVVGIPKLYFLGGIGVLTLLLIVGLIIFLAFMLFGLRWVVIMLCLLSAPLAIASYVLPGTQKMWAFWKNTTITSLAIFPVIMGLLASGEAMARVTSQIENLPGGYILVVVLFVGPILLIIPIAQKFGGVLGGAIGWASGLGSKAMGRGNKFLHDSSEFRKGEYATGSKNGPRLVRAYAQRSTLARQGGVSFTRGGRTQYRHARDKLLRDTVRKKAEDDHGFSLGDTDATRAAIMADSRRDFVSRYQAMGHSRQQAVDRLGMMEAGVGSQMGTRAMKAAAMRGQTVLDGAGWFNERENRFDAEGFAEAAHHLQSQGIYTAEELGAMLGENQQRADMSASSFSQRVEIAEWAHRGQLDANGQRIGGNGHLTDEQINTINSRTYQSMRNGSAELGNLRTARAVAVQGGQRLSGTLRGQALAGIEEGANGIAGDHNALTAEQRLAAEFASFANFQDMASSASPVAREQFARELQRQVTASQMDIPMQAILQPLLTRYNGTVTNQQIMDYLRGNATGTHIDDQGRQTQQFADERLVREFTARRREYSSNREAAGDAQARRENPVTINAGP
jgi:hypothetical protein